MKHFISRLLIGLAIVAALVMGVSSAAGASSPTSASPSTSTSTSASTAWTSWHATWVAYYDGLKAINLSYRSSVESARSAYFAAKAVATTPAKRKAARATFDAAVAADLNTRVAAITAAGDPPVPPAGYNGTAYVIGFQAAHVAFRAAADAARTAYAKALAIATTPEEHRAARLTYEAAIANAVVARSAALLALGTAPTHRGQPSS